ncbi:MAG: DegT/DnrJ/EryC1/StrS family aminotransferase [Nitrospiraceae bacterium]|nr:DegT/DnrJ/EryC1/StrS family aminotransferase [Nitrospiraceae bacterium]
MEIPFHKPYITDEEISGVVHSIRSGWLTMGPKTIEFEDRFAENVESAHAVSMNSCTACLHLALKAIGLREGDEVIVPSMTFTATSEVIAYFNAKPVFVDIETGTGNMDASKIESRITGRTRAIIPVHYAGQPCDMEEILAIAKKRGIYVIEDAAHSLPAYYRHRKIGSIGDITCFSFYATKTLCTGEGGMAVTNNEQWADTMRVLRLHGISSDAWKRYSKNGKWNYEVVDAGFKYNMTDIQAAMGLAQLGKLEWMWEARQDIAKKYNEAFSRMEEVIPPEVKPDRQSAWHLYPLKLKLEALNIGRDQFIDELSSRGIGASVHFIPLYRHPFYKNRYGCMMHEYPASEWVFGRVLSLPIFPGMMEEDVSGVIEVVEHLARKFKR